MNIKIFAVHYDKKSKCFFDEAVREFISKNKITRTKEHFFQSDNEHIWTIYIEYETTYMPKEDFKKYDLSDSELKFVDKLREWRRIKAKKTGKPIFLIFNNAEMIQLIKEKPNNIEALKTIRGFGKQKIQTYGEELIDLIKLYFFPDGKNIETVVTERKNDEGKLPGLPEMDSNTGLAP